MQATTKTTAASVGLTAAQLYLLYTLRATRVRCVCAPNLNRYTT